MLQLLLLLLDFNFVNVDFSLSYKQVGQTDKDLQQNLCLAGIMATRKFSYYFKKNNA
jgi:hypothetical protein